MVSIESYRPKEIDAPKVKMPLSFVPEAGKRFVSSELESVAGHELNHALVAMANGAYVISISLEPKGDSLARTTLGGLVSIETMKIIAGAGGVGIHDGCAEGYGSDKFKVDVLHHFHGGHSWESAKGRAANILSGYSREVREKAAEIIAYLRIVPGSLIPDIILRAKMEVDQEKGIESEPYVLTPVPQQEFKNQTIIDELPGNVQRIRYIVDGKVKKEELLCGVCQGINGHEKECPKTKLNENSESKPPESSKMLPIKAVIFSAKLLS